MRSKSIALLALASGVLALGVVGFSGLEGGAGLPNLVANADSNATRHLIVDASNFVSNSGNFTVDGIAFHYEGASVSEDIVTLTAGRVYMTMANYSGKEKNDSGYRGDGFTGLTISDYSSSGNGHIVYAKSGTSDGVTGTYSFANVIDLTHQNGGAEVASAGRRRIHLECGAATITFSKLDFSYSCAAVLPSISIEGYDAVNVDSSIGLTATTEDIFDSDAATYEWISSDPTKATVVGNGKTATVTGVAGADAVTITVNAKKGDDVLATDSLNIRVIATVADVVDLEVLKTTYWEGAGLFMHIKPNSVSGLTASTLETLPRSISLIGDDLSFSMSAGKGDYGHGGQKSDSDTVIYATSTPGAPAPTDNFTVKIEFVDSSENKVYVASARFVGSALKQGVTITAPSNDLLVGDTLELAVTNNEGGTPSYVWESSDTDVATVNPSGVVTGVADGSATITVTMTVNEKDYTDSVAIVVSSSGLVGTEITTLAGLKDLFGKGAPMHNSDSFYLGADIDCEGEEIYVAGDYSGTFNGNGHSISNFTVPSQGLFNIMSGTVKNLTASFSWTAPSAGHGAFCYSNTGTIDTLDLTVNLGGDVAGAVSSLQYTGNGRVKDVTQTVNFAKGSHYGAFFARTCDAAQTQYSGTNTLDYYYYDGDSIGVGASSPFTVTGHVVGGTD